MQWGELNAGRFVPYSEALLIRRVFAYMCVHADCSSLGGAIAAVDSQAYSDVQEYLPTHDAKIYLQPGKFVVVCRQASCMTKLRQAFPLPVCTTEIPRVTN